MAVVFLHCVVHPVPPGLSNAAQCVGELIGIPECSCLIFTLQLTARKDYELLRQQIGLHHQAYSLSANDKDLPCATTACRDSMNHNKRLLTFTDVGIVKLFSSSFTKTIAHTAAIFRSFSKYISAIPPSA